MATFGGSLEIRLFNASVSDEALEEFRQLLRLSKIGPATIENTIKAGSAFGLSRDWVANAREHWLTKYAW